MRARCEGVCFDLWNTLAATVHEPHPLDALADAFGLLGDPAWRRILEEAIMTRPLPGIGAALDELQRATGRAPSGRWSRRDLILMWGAACNDNRLYPDVLVSLKRIARLGCRIGVVSNTQSFDLDFLRRDGLAAIVDDLCLSCDCGLLKPDPAIFTLAAGRLGLEPAHILMIGDRLEHDVHPAREAGMSAARLDRRPGPWDPAPAGEGFVVHDLTELADRLERGEPFIVSSC
ncbi:MAG: HAD family hydrolase [Candidatus Polarisedimenticolia bacterium]